MIIVKNLSFGYEDNELIIKDFSYHFERTGIYIIKGKSGCGKTTFLKLLLGLLKPNSGSISYSNNELNTQNTEDMSSYRLKNIGYISQQNMDFSFLNPYEYVSLPSLFLNNKMSKKDFNNLCSFLNLDLNNKKNESLSGGEFQRLQIARALVNRPSIILADEPTSSLDEQNKQEIFSFLKQISKTTLVIIVTHEDVSRYLSEYIELNLKEKILPSELPNVIEEHHISQKKKINLSKLKGLFFYNIKKLKTKSLRSYLSILFSSFALIIFTLIISIVSCLKTEINSSTGMLFKNNVLTVSTNTNNSSNFTSLLHEDLSFYIEDSGCDYDHIRCYYEANFENLFIDENSFFVQTNNMVFHLPEYNVRSINNFILDKELELKDETEIGLGITRGNLYSITRKLSIENDINELNSYIFDNDFLITLYLKNEAYNYSDDFVFKVKKVFLNDENVILHNKTNFNEMFFEDYLSFVSVNDTHSKLDAINVLRKYNVVKFSNIDEVYNFEDYLNDNDIVLENLGCIDSSFQCDDFYMIPFFSNNDIINDSDFLTLKNEFNFDYIRGSQKGYFIDPSTGYSGFIGSLYCSNNSNKLDEIMNLIEYDDLTNDVSINSDNELLKGNILNLNGDNLVLKPTDRNLDINEVIVSNLIKEKFNLVKNQKLNFLYFLNGDFYLFELTIVDFIEDNKFVLFQNSNWFNRFLRDVLKVDSLSNQCDTIEIFFDENIDDKIIETFKERLGKYLVMSRSFDSYKEMNKNLNSILFITYLLFLVVSFINILILFFINKSIEIDSISENTSLMILGLNIHDILFSNLIRQIIINVLSTIQALISIVLIYVLLNDKIVVAGINIFNDISPITILIVLIYSFLNLLPFIINTVLKMKVRNIIKSS